MDNADLTALIRRAQRLAAQTQVWMVRSSLLPTDEKDVALANYRTIAGLCAQAIERLRPQDGPVSPEMVVAVQVFLQIARLCTNEHDRISQADEARREQSRRWSEVHDEFMAAQHEGRPMRSDWSWERHARWEGDIHVIPFLLAVALSTPVFAGMFWRWLVLQRRHWQREQARRQDILMGVDVERWTDYVTWSLATVGKSVELDRVRPLLKPTLRYPGEPGIPWLFVLAMWLASTLFCWMLFAMVVPMLLHPWQVSPVVPGSSVAEQHAACAQTWAALPQEIAQCCRRLSGVPCPRWAW